MTYLGRAPLARPHSRYMAALIVAAVLVVAMECAMLLPLILSSTPQ